MIMNLLLVRKMAIKSIKKNPMVRELFTKKYKSKIVKSKKEREVLKEKKLSLKSCTNLLYYH